MLAEKCLVVTWLGAVGCDPGGPEFDPAYHLRIFLGPVNRVYWLTGELNQTSQKLIRETISIIPPLKLTLVVSKRPVPVTTEVHGASTTCGAGRERRAEALFEDSNRGTQHIGKASVLTHWQQFATISASIDGGSDYTLYCRNRAGAFTLPFPSLTN